MKRNPTLPVPPPLQAVPRTAEEVMEYQILLASSNGNRRQREHKFTVPHNLVAEMKAFCGNPTYNKMSEPQRSKANPDKVIRGPEPLCVLEHRGDNHFRLTIAESELLHPAEVQAGLVAWEQADKTVKQEPKKKAA